MRSFLFWLLALGLGLTGFDAYHQRDGHGARDGREGRPFGERSLLVTPTDHAAVGEGGNGLPPPPR